MAPGPRLMTAAAVIALGAGFGVAAVVTAVTADDAPPAAAAAGAGAPATEAATLPDPTPAPEPSPEPEPEPEPTPPWTSGAGPDCGGPDSFEPPAATDVLFFTSTPGEGDGSNGNVPATEMTALPWCQDARGNHQWLRTTAATALIALNEAFAAEFGENIAIDLSYRSFADQVAMREHYGTLAARPGTSNHGLGTAFDTWEWAAYGFGSERYEWLVAHGPEHGWVAPDWAREDGVNPEYWHFEYVG